ncbi:hypothetical protein ACLQ24_16440 [Micromonospora sp. DT4]|uniref:hypothetical protein n=1 Tax=Micromonospora sp. DT4 TaxID=3393438 RepID=UPI003CF1D09A
MSRDLREAAMGQPLAGERAVVVRAHRWRAGLPADAWPDDFPTNGKVWRQDVFAVVGGEDGIEQVQQLGGACGVTDKDSLHFFPRASVGVR